MAKLTVEIVTAERQVYNETDVDMVVAPGSEGVLGILPRHAPLLTMLKPGPLRVKKNGTEQEMAVAGGFLQVNDDRVLILADHAERSRRTGASQDGRALRHFGHRREDVRDLVGCRERRYLSRRPPRQHMAAAQIRVLDQFEPLHDNQ